MMKWVKRFLIQPNQTYFAVFAIVGTTLLFLMPNTFVNMVMLLCIAPASWCLQEYLAHRYLMHGYADMIRKAHFRHHANPHDKTKIFIPILLSLVFATGNVVPIYCAFGKWLALSNFASSIFCYMVFEWVHYDSHSTNQNRWLKPVRQFHLLHHAVQPEETERQQNFGFTSAAFDLLFGTCDRHTQKSEYVWILMIPFPVVPFLLHEYMTNRQ